MTKKENNDCGDRFSQVQYRYRRLCYEMFCETNKCGPSDRDDDVVEDDSEFQIHRKMLRRRHVRKEQKELARRRKELEERERTCRENHGKETSDEISIDPLVPGGCCDRDQSHDSPRPTLAISTLPPSPPPTTVDAIFTSPEPKDHTSVRQSMVPNFSPIRSKKLRTRIF